ncbi:MAG: tyrosine-type recombinase/integrase [Planctomycetota bacterium]
MSDLVSTNLDLSAELVLDRGVPVDREPAAVYLASLAPSSRRTQGQALNAIAGILTGVEESRVVAWHRLRYQHTQALRSRLAESYRPATANRMLSALRGVLREAWRLGHIAAEDFHRAVDLKPVRGATLPAGRTLTSGEIHALFGACCDDRGPAGVRDAAILGVLFGAGLRRQEVVLLDVGDFDADCGELRIQGKGSKEREAFATNGILEALRDWIAIRGVDAGPLFVPISKSGKLGSGRLSAQAIYNLLRTRSTQAGVKRLSPHDLRRTFATMLLEAGADVAVVAGLMGHASIETTRRYDRRDSKARKRAVDMLHVPYRRAS